MNGYIAVVTPHPDEGFDVRFPDLDGCAGRATCAEDAWRTARRALRHHHRQLAARGHPLPPPRPSYEMIEVARRLEGVAALCLSAPLPTRPPTRP